MRNARKREAPEPLLPMMHPKHRRLEEPTPQIHLAARWAQLAYDAAELFSETIKTFVFRTTTTVHDPPSRSIPPRYRRAHSRSPRAAHVRTSDRYSMHSSSDPTHGSGSLPRSSPTGTVARSSARTGDDLLADSMQQCRKEQEFMKRRKDKEHIYARKHKVKVKEDRMKDREAVMKELFDLKRASGFKSSFDDFKSYIDYQARLQHLDDRDSLSPSASLTDLRLKEDTPGLSHRHSFSNYADVPFLENAKNKLLRTLASPPTKPFSTHDWLRQEARKKDEQIEQRFRPSLPKLLPPDMDRHVDGLLARKGVISKIAREQICDRDLSRLLPCQWLNDELINFYGAMILERSEACKENPGANGRKRPLNAHYFNTFFWSKLQDEGYERARLAKWTKKFDIFSKDVILIPINHNNSHWTGAAINFRRKRIESYDSMSLDRYQVFKTLRHYLDLEHQNKKKKPFDFTGWVNYSPDDTPQQENGYDCGVFTCQFLEALSRGEEVFNFSQRDMAYLRRRMIWEIGNAKFLDVP